MQRPKLNVRDNTEEDITPETVKIAREGVCILKSQPGFDLPQAQLHRDCVEMVNMHLRFHPKPTQKQALTLDLNVKKQKSLRKLKYRKKASKILTHPRMLQLFRFDL